MAVVDTKKTYKNLKSKGFVDAENKSDDHKYLELYYNGKLVLYTKVSHSSKDIGEPLIRQMSHQCKLAKADFINLAKCPLSRQEYIDILEQQGLLH